MHEAALVAQAAVCADQSIPGDCLRRTPRAVGCASRCTTCARSLSARPMSGGTNARRIWNGRLRFCALRPQWRSALQRPAGAAGLTVALPLEWAASAKLNSWAEVHGRILRENLHLGCAGAAIAPEPRRACRTRGGLTRQSAATPCDLTRHGARGMPSGRSERSRRSVRRKRMNGKNGMTTAPCRSVRRKRQNLRGSA